MNYIISCVSDDVSCDQLRTQDPNITTVLLNYSRKTEHQLSLREWQSPRCVVRDISMTNEGKWKNIRRFLHEMSETIQAPSSFWFPDPDLQFNQSLPGQLFAIMDEFKLPIAQPSLTDDSKCCWHHFYCQNAGVRRVPFCEIMCPAFSLDALRRNLWTFGLTFSGYGVDLLWGQNEDCYCLDQITVRHLRQPNYEHTARAAGFPDPQIELAEMRRKYKLP